MSTTKRRVAIVLGIAISVVTLWWSLQGTDYRQIGESLRRANWWLLFPLMLAYSGHYLLKAYRWTCLLEPMKKTTSSQVFAPMMIGFMGNNVLPAHLGEFVRMYLGAETLGLRKTQVLATIVLERIFDFLSVVLFLGLVILLGRDVPEQLILPGTWIGIGGVFALIVAVLYITRTRWFVGVVRRTTGFLPHAFQARILDQLQIGATGMHALKRGRLLFLILITSVAQWALMGACTYFATLAIGATPPVSSGLVVLAATTFAVTVPAAPGFLGMIQVAFVLALVPYGVSKGDAFAASAVFHVPTYLAVTLLGIWLLRRRGLGLSQLQEKAEEAAETTHAEPDADELQEPSSGSEPGDGAPSLGRGS